MSENIQVIADRKDIVAIANAVRSKTGTTAQLSLSDMVTSINGVTPKLQSKSVSYTSNGTETVAPDSGYDGLSSVNVTVNVAGSGGGGGENKLAKVVDGSITQLTAEDLAGATSISDSAFYNCMRLTSITIPDSVISIDDYAFTQCTSLASITIPDSVTSIGHGAFQNCYSLTSITIPDSVTSIGEYAFSNCDNLTDIYVPWAEGAVSGAPWYATRATIHYNTEFADGELA